MRVLRAASFDLYGRYSHLWNLRRDAFGPAPLRILDVGDPFGTIAALLPDDHTVSLDLYVDGAPSGRGHQHVIGSGFELPFPDRHFDVVCSHDTFEHLPAERRPDFVDELLRVSRGPVLLVAPFDDDRTRLCESIVNGYFVARLGHSIPALDEHEMFGLPSLAELSSLLDEKGVAHEARGDGWLYHWVAFYLLRAHFTADNELSSAVGLDAAFNELLVDRDRAGPHYRRMVVLRPPAGLRIARDPQLESTAPEAGHRADLDRLGELGRALTAALVHGADPRLPGSRLRVWMEGHAGGTGPFAELARSLDLAFGESREPVAAPARAEAEPPRVWPTVAVVLVNLDGAQHLPDCLDSLAALDYPRERLEVVVVDNGSRDGSLELLARYPWVRVLAQDTNLGFAPAVNVGVRSTTADCIALLNNDMRVEPDWLSELVRAYDPEAGVVCVGAQILSWDGERLDFGEGSLNFYGMGFQVGYNRPLETVRVRDGAEILFACGGAMVVSREVYLNSGGFDDDFFAYFEDVDFGWRLWVLGYRVRLAAGARCYHRMHGTSSRFPEHQRILLYERNALRSMIKNHDDDDLQRLLGPALLLLAKRAVIRGDLDRHPYDIGGDTDAVEAVPRVALAHLHAVADVVDNLDTLLVARERIARARRRGSDEIFELFGRPFQPVVTAPDYLAAQHNAVAGFHLRELFSRRRATHALVVSNDPIADKMSGPAIRAWEMAQALAATVDVTVAVPEPSDKLASGVSFAVYDDEDDLRLLANESDVVLVQGYAVRRAPALARTRAVLVVDLYDPWIFENLEILSDQAEANRMHRIDMSVLHELLAEGDFFICASERQRDYWLGMLSAQVRVTDGTYARDPTLRSLIDVVPFGLPDRPPRHEKPVLRGVHPAIGEDDPVVIWGGGTWDWLDPVTVIKAFSYVVREVPNAKLYFLGLQLSTPNVAQMEMVDRALNTARDLKLAGSSVIFGDWAPYDLREAFLLEADVAVIAARDVAEARLAFRTRALDYFWAGLPVVTTAGDVLADVVTSERIGEVVPPGDVRAFADALLKLLKNPGLRAECARNGLRVAERYRWPVAVEPLRRVAREPWRWRGARNLAAHDDAPTEETQLLLAHMRRQQDELDHLRTYAATVEESLAHAERRLDLLRRTPAYPVFRAAQRIRRWARAPLGRA